MEPQSKLEGLPRELAWKIIEFVPESVFSLRLTSRVLRARVDEYALERGSVTLVNELIIFINECGSPSVIDIFIEVPRSKSDLFELRLKLRQTSPNLGKISRQCEAPGTSADKCCYVLKYDDMSEDDGFLEYLGDCMGRRIGKVSLFQFNDSGIVAVARLFRGIRFKKLRVKMKTLSNDAADFLLSRIRSSKVDKLSLRVSQVTADIPEKIMLDLSSLVRTLNIDQHFCDEIYQNSPYFFGLHDFDWAPIIVEMLSRKLDKLCIFNVRSPEYLSRRSAEMLEKCLPVLGKKVWFETICNAYANPYLNRFSYTKNDYAVEADHLYLRIRHLSRMSQKSRILS
ncbi:hypothetical protein PMAYCL1PPCAC_19493 [Pristionchus mayeri]|uniref:F-box domain-containing protein n=1 Tax=Pristionchus mayeri TaxID=1317129 RepID=A0AAN5CRK4_9BILA|nr:hypothetical protein PMAYCL1PPCAC_19493 [Pristionchus mayeri]